MRTPRDAFLTALCKSCLPPKFAMSLITSHRAANSGVQDLGSPEKREVSESDPAVSGGIRGGLEGGGGSGGIKKKLSFPAGDTVSGGPVAGVGDGGGKAITPVSSQKGLQSALVSLNRRCVLYDNFHSLSRPLSPSPLPPSHHPSPSLPLSGNIEKLAVH